MSAAMHIAMPDALRMAAESHDDQREAQRRWINSLTEDLGLDYTNLARKARLNPTTLTRFMKDADGTNKLRPSTLKAIEAATRKPLPAELAVSASPMATAAMLPDAVLSPTDPVPLFSLYGALGLQEWAKNEQPGDMAPRPPGIARNRSVYALRMPDDSMAPWRRPNELIYVDPTRATGEGDHALVELSHPRDANHPRNVYRLRRYLGRTRNGQVRLASYASDQVETIPAERVVALHRILEWSEVAIG